MQKPIFRTLWASICLALSAVSHPVNAQVGYISLHVKTLNEESSPNFTYTISNGAGAVASFNLNDLPSQLKCSDLGGSHSADGKGQLWVITGATANTGSNGMLYYRDMGKSGWVSTGDSALAVDGAGPRQCVYTNAAGDVVAYNNGGKSTLYTPAHHGGHKALDIGNNASLTPETGVTVITDDRGHLLAYRGTYADGNDAWTDVSQANPSFPAGITHVDVNIGNDNVLFSLNNEKIYQAGLSGTPTYLGTAGTAATNADVAYDDKGGIFCIAKNNSTQGDGVYKWQGGLAWKGDSTSRMIEHITGGAADALWGVNDLPTDGDSKSEIFARSTDATGFWYDNEWVNPTTSDAILLPVPPGTYTVTQSLPTHWSCLGVALYDPAGLSSGSVPGASAAITVSAGEVVTANFKNGLVQPANIPQRCTYAIQQDFGSGAAAYGDPLTGITDYHFIAKPLPEDGFYTVTKTTGTAWGNKNLVDHTTGNGYFMIVNASYAKDQFYRERVTGLVPGLHYSLSAYIANISPALPLKPNVLFGISDANTGVTLGSLSTGDINNTTWQQYSFTFVATTTTADIFLSNNSIGGSGNDLALDDIAFDPIPDPISPIRRLGSDTLCAGSSLTLSDTTASGTWTSLDPTLASINPTGQVTGLGGGVARLRFSTTNQIGCTAADTMRVTVFPHVAPSDIQLSHAVICTGDSISLHAASATIDGPHFSWFADSALSVLLDTGSIYHTPLLTANAYYYVTASGNNVCPNLPGQYATAGVTVSPYPVVPPLTNTSVLCAGSTISLNNALAGGQWNCAPDSIAWADSTGLVHGRKPGNALITYTVTNPGGCSTTVRLPVQVGEVPLVDSILGAHPICQNTGLDVSDGTPGGTWALSDTGIAALDQSGHISGVSVGSTLVTYTVTNHAGCSTRATAPLAVQGIPETPSIKPGPVPSVCGGRSMTLTAAPGTASRYTWMYNGSPVAAADSTDTLAVKEPGYYMAIAYTSAGCASPSSLPFEVSSRCEIVSLSDLALRKEVSPGPYTLQKSVTYTLTVTNKGPGEAKSIIVTDTLSPNLGEPSNYQGGVPYYDGVTRALYWQIPSLMEGDSLSLSFEVPIEALNTTINTAYVTSTVPDPDTTNNHGSAVIYQEGDLFIPNAVSPNGDGKNDRFLIVGLDRFPGSSLSVFNRWGNEVYHSDNYQNDWDGRTLSDGTYFYVLLLNTPQGKKAYKGWVEILHK
jgi:gliding motility-associated-like protein/uncharacterized repeat protein (TIGR01451 family)